MIGQGLGHAQNTGQTCGQVRVLIQLRQQAIAVGHRVGDPAQRQQGQIRVGGCGQLSQKRGIDGTRQRRAGQDGRGVLRIAEACRARAPAVVPTGRLTAAVSSGRVRTESPVGGTPAIRRACSAAGSRTHARPGSRRPVLLDAMASTAWPRLPGSCSMPRARRSDSVRAQTSSSAPGGSSYPSRCP